MCCLVSCSVLARALEGKEDPLGQLGHDEKILFFGRGTPDVVTLVPHLYSSLVRQLTFPQPHAQTRDLKSHHQKDTEHHITLSQITRYHTIMLHVAFQDSGRIRSPPCASPQSSIPLCVSLEICCSYFNFWLIKAIAK